MDVLIDSSVWSLALRRRSPVSNHLNAINQLNLENRIRIIGPVRQECLSGISNSENFARLRKYLRAFPDIPIVSEDYELAASFYNTCRSRGIQGSHIDFLICAVTHRTKLLLYTADTDFNAYAQYIPIRRFEG